VKLIDVPKAFATDEMCLAYLEAKRWPTVCAARYAAKEVSKITRTVDPTSKKKQNKRTQLYQCLDPTCKQQFSATSGTIFHDSHLPLGKWFMAIALMVDAKKSISALQLKRHLGVNYRTAWCLAHRIREAMNESDGLKLGRSRTPNVLGAGAACPTVIGSRLSSGNYLNFRGAGSVRISFDKTLSKTFFDILTRTLGN